LRVYTGADRAWLFGISLETLDNLTPCFAFVLVLAGLSWVVYTRRDKPEEFAIDGEPRVALRGISRTSRIARRQAPPPKPLSNLQVCSCAAASAILLVLVPLYLLLLPPTPKGLKVFIPKLGTLSASGELGNEPLVLRVGVLNLLYMNRRPVSRADFAERLRDLLSLRGDKTVFLDGDESNQYGWMAEAVSEIQEAWDAKVVLVTPSMKKEDPRLDGRSPCEPVALYTKMLKHLPKRAAPYVFRWYTLISYAINERGGVSAVRVLERSGFPDYDAWLLRSIERWRFRPLAGCGTQEVRVMMWPEVDY